METQAMDTKTMKPPQYQEALAQHEAMANNFEHALNQPQQYAGAGNPYTGVAQPYTAVAQPYTGVMQPAVTSNTNVVVSQPQMIMQPMESPPSPAAAIIISVLVFFLCCCPVFGLIAFILAVTSGSQPVEARKRIHMAQQFNIAGAVVGGILWAIYLFLVILSAARSSSYDSY